LLLLLDVLFFSFLLLRLAESQTKDQSSNES
jgi:hypothetical protein